MTFSQLFAILRARWIVATATFTVLMAAVALTVWLLPRTYSAEASVVLDVKNADPIIGSVVPSIATPAYLMTQVDVIKSSRVARRVVRDLHLLESDLMQANWRKATQGTGDFDAWLANLLRANLEARPSRGSNVIHISYQASDPRFAASVANGFVQAYLATVVELRNQPARQSKDFLDTNAAAARKTLEGAQARLSDYLQSQDIVGSDERIDVETNRLQELSTQYVNVQAAAAESRSRQDAAQTEGDRAPDVVASPLVTQLKADLIRQQTQLEQLSTRLGDSHPQVLEARTGIAETARKLSAEIQRVSGSVGVGNNVNESRLARIKSAMDQQRAKVMHLKASRDQAAILQRDVDNAQRAYDGILTRMATSNLESQANQANVSMLESAPVPSVPASPRVFSYLTLGGVASAALALALTLLVEHLQRRLRSTDDVERLLDQSVVVRLPSFAASRSGLLGRLKPSRPLLLSYTPSVKEA